MSASEKLKALTLQPIVYTDGDFKFRDGFSEESLRPLLAALPHVVAVVEAAERTTEAWHGPGGTGMLNTTHSRQRTALAALDEALQ